MSKEKLEELKGRVLKNKAHYKSIETGETWWGYSYELSDKDYEWLIKQAERLHGTNHKTGYIDMYADCNRMVGNSSLKIHKLEQQNERYREALEEIKKEETVTTALSNGQKAYTFSGHVARKALEGKNDE